MAEQTSTAPPIREVQIEALVVMRIIKHSTSTFPTPATGCLVGMDVSSNSGQQLQVTNSFPFPASVPEQPQDQFYPTDAATLAAAAPRAKSNVSYQNEMIKLLREVNVDAQSVGWYTSTNMGNFINQNFIENQVYFQKAADEKTIALVFDVSRSSAGSLNIKAYRLSPSFMASFREGKFTTERYDIRLLLKLNHLLMSDEQHPKVKPTIPRYPGRAAHHDSQLAPPHIIPTRAAARTTFEDDSRLPFIPSRPQPRSKHNINASRP